MKRLILPLAALSLGSCAHGEAARPAGERGRGIPIALKPITSGPELDGNALPADFERSLCSALFDLNDRQVVCPDDAQAYLKAQCDASLLGGPAASLQEADRMLAAPRSLALKASKGEGRVLVGGLLIDSEGRPLGRFEKSLAADGGDLSARARELAAEVAAVP